MKQNRKPGIKTKKIIGRRKRSKTMSKLKLVENMSKNLQIFLEIRPNCLLAARAYSTKIIWAAVDA